MTSPKGLYYTAQLFVVATAGDWASDNPSKNYRRGGLSWTELLRKFRKHCPDAHALADIISYTQLLSLLLIRSQGTTPEGLDGDHTESGEPLSLGAECLLREEHRDDALTSYKELKGLPKDEAVHLTLAYYAYSLGLLSDSLAHLSSVNYDDILSSLNASNMGSLSTTVSIPTTTSSRIVSGSTIGGSAPSILALESGLREGKVWRLIQLVRGRCLEGMAYESLSPRKLAEALKSYENAMVLLDQISIPKSFSSTVGQANFESFTQYRELWRWVERVLWRGALISSQTQSSHHTRQILQLYQAHSVHWPPTFRPEHRSTIAQLHLHILIQTHNPRTKTTWLNETRSIVMDYQMILTATTAFPRAGERNVKVEEFVDLCVAAWEIYGANGDQTGWVLDILWWATRFTFNSQRIYRHLFRLLYASGDIELAKRTLNLYVRVVSKARETGALVDPDSIWVSTLIQGARMLCRVPGGVDEAREAGELLRKAEEKIDTQTKDITAALKRAKGIWHVCMALREQDPSTRPEHLSQSLKELQESLALHPDPSTHFHLALALYRPGPSRDIGAAISNAKEAVLGSTRETRYWHLLGLLLSAIEEWKDAKVALQKGAELEEEEEGNDTDGAVDTPSMMSGMALNDEELSQGWTGSLDDPYLNEQSLRLPEAVTLLRPIPDFPPPTRHERFEHALQLRLTQLALTEHVDGPENASNKWLEVFSWVAARKGLGEEGRPPSVEPPSSAPSEVARQIQRQSLTLVKSRASQTNGDANININLIPPSPTPSRNGDGDAEKHDPKEVHKGKKVQRLLRDRVHKGQAHIHTISRKIGGKHVNRVKRTSSLPDFLLTLTNSKPYQASSIHSRQRLSMNVVREHSPEPPPPASPKHQASIFVGRSSRERRLLSNLWLTSAATFRRVGKIEQAKAAIQEAEVADEDNEEVWVQLGLYHAALGETEKAIQSFHKALFLQPDHVAAFVYLTQQYLRPRPASVALGSEPEQVPPSQESIDLAAGLLTELTRGLGWDVPEAWYFLARANKLQGKLERESECLSFALSLVEGRAVRDVRSAVGWCL